MKLPNLSETNWQLPQRTSMVVVGAWIIKDIAEIDRALIVAGLIAIGIILRTATTITKMFVNKPKKTPEK